VVADRTPYWYVVAHAGEPLERVHGLEVSSQGGVHAGAVEDPLLAVEVDELLQRQRVAHEESLHELGRDGMGFDEPGQQALAEEAHQQQSLPFRQRFPGAVRCLAAVGREQVQVRMPVQAAVIPMV
jgi:hypothetical protein